MAERIINIVCPNCKHGIKHDTLMNTTTGTPPEDYPAVNEFGRCWCKRCQHGTTPTPEGLCSECANKGIETRLRPKVKASMVSTPVKEQPEEQERAVIEEEKELEKGLSVEEENIERVKEVLGEIASEQIKIAEDKEEVEKKVVLSKKSTKSKKKSSA